MASEHSQQTNSEETKELRQELLNRQQELHETKSAYIERLRHVKNEAKRIVEKVHAKCKHLVQELSSKEEERVRLEKEVQTFNLVVQQKEASLQARTEKINALENMVQKKLKMMEDSALKTEQTLTGEVRDANAHVSAKEKQLQKERVLLEKVCSAQRLYVDRKEMMLNDFQTRHHNQTHQVQNLRRSFEKVFYLINYFIHFYFLLKIENL